MKTVVCNQPSEWGVGWQHIVETSKMEAPSMPAKVSEIKDGDVIQDDKRERPQHLPTYQAGHAPEVVILEVRVIKAPDTPSWYLGEPVPWVHAAPALDSTPLVVLPKALNSSKMCYALLGNAPLTRPIA